MSSKTDQVSIDLAIKIVGKWKETYGWIPIFAAFAAIFMAFFTGANNLPAPFSTPIGSGSLTLLKAFVMACVIYVPGAAFASSTSTVNALFSYFLKENQPSEGFLMWSLVVVLITAAIWLALATYLQLPVSSLQSIQGALLGTILVTQGFGYIPLWNKNQNHNFIGGGLVWIVLEWTVAPLIAFLCAFLLFALMKVSLLRHENAEKRILVFLPIDYGISAGLLCLFLMYQVLPHMIALYSWVMIVAVTVATLIGALLSLLVVVPLAMKKLKAVKNYKTMKRNMTKSSDHSKSKCIESQDPTFNDTKSADDEAQFEEALKDFMQMRVLDTVYEEDERSWGSPDTLVQEPENKLAEDQSPASQDQSNIDKSTSFRKLLESTPNQLVQSHTRNFQKIEKATPIGNAFQFLTGSSNSFFSPVMEYDRHTLIRHALAEKYDDVEDFFSFPHLIASCIFALIQSTNEVAAVVSPYGAILDVFHNREKYSGNGEHVGSIHVTWWFKAIGGFGAAIGFFLCGFRVTQSLGGKLTYMSNSRGLAAQLSTVAAIIIVTKIKLPVSTIHALVGSLVGVGIADDPRNVNWKLLFKFMCGWVMTIVFCSGVAYVIFSVSIHSPAYVVR
ncbi:phosphate-repressible phosphate permease pho-4-like isoform X1 [Rosa rugosa]|uniref:phosphate-repressible phosphate permease pho-4-like isoform X1 n=2 Tax=Rosa rugosa TaxID=74645 RepID=UPI002B4052B1|nr:phosphate-repressible phosphate permease pho-4-like isoform X1 [Rosa rugosa]